MFICPAQPFQGVQGNQGHKRAPLNFRLGFVGHAAAQQRTGCRGNSSTNQRLIGCDVHLLALASLVVCSPWVFSFAYASCSNGSLTLAENNATG
jgi:hypothetical protein